MKRYHIVILISIFVMSLSVIRLWADEREPKDIIVALDKSLSMEEEIEEVKRYVNTYIVDKTLINGDYFLLLSFFRNAEVAAAATIQNESSKQNLKEQISKIDADGPFTDIGNVLDRLGDEMIERINNGRNKSFLLITDGINEPPPNSRYYTSDGILRHEYLEKLDDILVKETWKVQVLALGTDAQTKDFAHQLQANYIEAGDNLTAEQIAELAPDVAGVITLTDSEKSIIRVSGTGTGTLKLKIKTDGFLADPSIEIDQISLSAGPYFKDDVLKNNFQKILPKTGETTITIPISVTGKLQPGNYPGVATFNFTSKEKFPSKLNTQLHINNIIEDFPWLLPIIIVAILLILGLLALLISKIILGKSIQFKIVIEEAPLPKNRDTFTVNKAKSICLVESMDMIRITETKSIRAFAELKGGENGLILNVLKEKFIPEVTGELDNVIGKSIRVVTEQNTVYHIKFTEPA